MVRLESRCICMSICMSVSTYLNFSATLEEQNRTEQKFYSKFHKAIKPARIQTSTIRDGIWQCEYSYIHNNADLYLDYL